MDWWNNFVAWIQSDDGWRIITGAIIPFLAIIVAGIIAALIGRGATRRLVSQRDQETRASAVEALITVGQSAARWHSQTPAAKEQAETIANHADVTVRLLPLAGAGLAADWAAHQLNDMRTNSVSFSFQADQTLGEYRDRLVQWLHHPNRSRKLFAADLERWRYEDQSVDPVVVEQQKWAEQQFTAATNEVPEHVSEVPLPSETADAAAAAAAAEPAPVPAAESTTGTPYVVPVVPITPAAVYPAATPSSPDSGSTPLVEPPATTPFGGMNPSAPATESVPEQTFTAPPPAVPPAWPAPASPDEDEDSAQRPF